ncbi:hypothetical protein P5V15_006096 [Pogonomyrmex californicus]
MSLRFDALPSGTFLGLGRSSDRRQISTKAYHIVSRSIRVVTAPPLKFRVPAPKVGCVDAGSSSRNSPVMRDQRGQR